MLPTRAIFQRRSATPALSTVPATATIASPYTAMSYPYAFSPMAPPPTPTLIDTTVSHDANYGCQSTMVNHSSAATIPSYSSPSQKLDNYSYDMINPVFLPFTSQATSSIEFKPTNATSDESFDATGGSFIQSYIPPICNDHPFGCPRNNQLSDCMHKHMIDIMMERGRKRFPTLTHTFLANDNAYDPKNMPLAPGTFSDMDLAAIYAATPVYLQVPLSAMLEESSFQGIVYRLETENIFHKMQGQETIKRGTTIILNNLESRLVRYIVTIRRHLNSTTSMIQLNAYIWNNYHLQYNNLDWPTLLLTIPNYLCDVPMPDVILPHFTQYLTIPPPGYQHARIDTSHSALKHEQ